MTGGQAESKSTCMWTTKATPKASTYIQGLPCCMQRQNYSE